MKKFGKYILILITIIALFFLLSHDDTYIKVSTIILACALFFSLNMWLHVNKNYEISSRKLGNEYYMWNELEKLISKRLLDIEVAGGISSTSTELHKILEYIIDLESERHDLEEKIYNEILY